MSQGDLSTMGLYGNIRFGYPARMTEEFSDLPNRLRERRKAASLTQEALARLANTTAGTINKLETGQRSLTVEWMERLAPPLNCAPYELMKGAPPQPETAIPLEEKALRIHHVPLVGTVGAGAKVHFLNVEGMHDGDEEVESPVANVVAVRVIGDSMWPAYRDGDTIYYRKECEGVIAEYVRKECVVRLVDGRTYIKTLLRGSRPGLFTLQSYNAPPIEDAEVEWACPVLYTKRG